MPSAFFADSCTIEVVQEMDIALAKRFAIHSIAATDTSIETRRRTNALAKKLHDEDATGYKATLVSVI